MRIPAGKFLMGSPETEKDRDMDEVQHEVTISKPFYMGITHVTVDQFAAFVKDSGYKTDAEKDGWSDRALRSRTAKSMPQGGRLLVAQPGFRSEGRSSGGAGKLERRQGVLRLAVQEERQDGDAADRGAMGICLPCGDDDGVSVGRQSR